MSRSGDSLGVPAGSDVSSVGPGVAAPTRSQCPGPRVAVTLADQEIPGPANRDPDSRFPAKSGIGDSLFPGQNRGFPPRFPAKKSGIGADSGDPIPVGITVGVSPSINRSGLGIYSAASIMPVLSQAACGSYSGSKDGACCCE